ncbi:MAG: DUF6249 domain-containing protein [Phocaeicola sp.]
MKSITTLYLFLFLLIGSLSAQKVIVVPSAADSSRMDTIVISQMADDEETEYADDEANTHSYSISASLDKDSFGIPKGIALIPILGIIFVFGFPVAIVALVLWFKYKNRQAKYKFMSEALATGQPLPKDFMENLNSTSQDEVYSTNNKLKNKGIQNIFLGIGLGVFMWLLTDTIGLAAIGFIILCMGVGQVIMAYTDFEKHRKRETFHSTEADNKPQQPNSEE